MRALHVLRMSALVGVLLTPGLAAWAETVKVGLIDFALRHEALSRFDNVKVRSITFETSEMPPARFQTTENKRGHADVMAQSLVEAFQSAAPDVDLELFVASPFLQNAKTGQQVIDLEQLEFAYTWLARQGVKVVAQTFVARDSAALAEAITTATDLGLIILSSAGNGPRQNVVPPFPASYPDVIGISTTALGADLGQESNRDSYARYSVKAPAASSLRLRDDPELAILAGSSRATVAAAGYLGAMATRYRLNGREDVLIDLHMEDDRKKTVKIERGGRREKK